MKISIVTPSYNQGKFIEATIQSVLAQDHPDFEYIVMDGGSNDDTLNILRRYENRLTWTSQTDDGFADAINQGFQQANGNIFAWINSDDVYLSPTVLSEVAQIFSENPALELIYGQAIYTNSDGEPLNRSPIGKPFDLISALSYENPIPQPSAFWRRGLWDRLGGLREDLRYAVDLDLWLRAWESGTRPRFFPRVWSSYRLHNASKTVAERLTANLEREVLAKAFLMGADFSKGEKKFIRSNLAETLMRAYRDQGDLKNARKQAWLGLRLSPLRPRWVYLALANADLYLGSDFAEKGRKKWQARQ